VPLRSTRSQVPSSTMPQFRILAQKLKTRESIRKRALQRGQSNKHQLGEEEVSTDQTKGGVPHQLNISHSESTTSSPSTENIRKNSEDSYTFQRGSSSSRKDAQHRGESSDVSPNRTSGEDGSESLAGSPQSDNGNPDDAIKDYPSWTRCSFKPWNEPDESNEIEYSPSVTDDDADRSITIREVDPPVASLPTQEQTQNKESDDDASLISNASSNESDTSDLDSLDNFLKNIFGCPAQQELEKKDNLNAEDENKGGIVENVIEPVQTGWNKDSVHNMDSTDAIYTSHSKHSRRRAYKGRSVMSVDEMSLSVCDSVIEMTSSKVVSILMLPKIDYNIVDEERNPEDSCYARNSGNDPERTTEEKYTEQGVDDDRNQSSIGKTYVPSERQTSNQHEAKESDLPSISTLECHGPTMGTKHSLTQIEQPKRWKGTKCPHWAPIIHPRAPNTIRDQVTMLPDNLPPMARLRYCRASNDTSMYA
jgi:hypothetical protein